MFILEQGVGVTRRYRGVAGRITLSFCLFLPSLHNFRRWCGPRRGKVDNRLPGAKTPVLCTPIFALYSNTFALLPPTSRAHALVWRNYTLSSRLLHCSRVTSYGHDIQRRERYPYIPHHKVCKEPSLDISRFPMSSATRKNKLKTIALRLGNVS